MQSWNQAVNKHAKPSDTSIRIAIHYSVFLHFQSTYKFHFCVFFQSEQKQIFFYDVVVRPDSG